MNSNTVMIKKLQAAINKRFGARLLVNSNQWYSDKADKAITTWSVKKAVFDESKNKNVNVELFKSTSQIQIVLFLRDLWYELNGWEVPTDNEMWNEVKQKQGLQK